MAKKFYAIKIGKTPGIYTTWDEAKAQVDGYPGAKYKGFSTLAEAEEFLETTASNNSIHSSKSDAYSDSLNTTKLSQVEQSDGATSAFDIESWNQLFGIADDSIGESSSGSSANNAASAIKTDIISPEKALLNLRNVKVGGKNGIAIQSAQVAAAGEEKTKLIEEAFELAYNNPVAVTELTNRSDVQKLMSKYNIDLQDASVFANCDSKFEAVAFVDGGGDKVGEAFESTKIVFSTVFYDSKSSQLSFYRYVLEKGTDFDWLFRASNVAGEELAALLSMYICRKKGLSSLAIYQDNNLPAKFLSSAFKVIHNMDDVTLQYFVNAVIGHLEAGIKINFIYVPSEHAASASKAKMVKGRRFYEAQEIDKLSFEQALFYNAISDRLADFSISLK